MRKKIPDAGVARHLSVPDLWNGILGLKHQPDALDGRGERIRNGTRDSSEEEIGDQICEEQLVLKHAISTVTVLRPLLSHILRIVTDPKRILTKKFLG